uniref:DoxX family protein n=1 Tax=Dunaliella tertiolecta TaxID=3047 RepID=A0A7S3QS12_DUNTE|mmetsp:Transcript_22241/g.61487  ORF Transcript_22241/g.61487 Transcript_22241/m.61487 type:complete len:171 (-) Transcript_22241:414-926(-)|eukprot:CAMPEP_0202362030 /NCGR_PEP_ID=MMETSP1126-20121109/14358_1 /ASSEMBLY_ACC=CAM_ASM_000457 /TAXON_ID=3047 /ORGANISM="Dunaliella tertiolecta, Strain CCMP1320" /LENGTH=170 /DNA_ID=CAMNT_0048956105 /DNA_START=51 /DNA_END=563 /DNA_ORIENTATION=-
MGIESHGASLGRFLLGLGFMIAAISIVGQFDKETGGTAMRWVSPKLDQCLDRMERFTGFRPPVEKGQYPQILLAASTTYFFGSVLLMANVRFGASILLMALTLTSLVMHNFWDYSHDPLQQQAETAQFMKNIGIAGGLIYYLATSEPFKAPQRHPKPVPSTRIAAASSQG